MPRLLGMLLVLAASGGCSEFGVSAGDNPHREFNFLDMGDQPKVKAQRGDLLGGADLLPPSGAVPIGFEPYPYRGQPELAGIHLKNPLAVGDPKVEERGKLMYERFCVPCHGAAALGDGTVVEKGFPKPPSLMSQRVRDWTDGRIFHVITDGQNIMPSYSSQIRPDDRWAVIRHVRKMHSQQPVTPADSKVQGEKTPAPSSTGQGEPLPPASSPRPLGSTPASSPHPLGSAEPASSIEVP